MTEAKWYKPTDEETDQVARALAAKVRNMFGRNLETCPVTGAWRLPAGSTRSLVPTILAALSETDHLLHLAQCDLNEKAERNGFDYANQYAIEPRILVASALAACFLQFEEDSVPQTELGQLIMEFAHANALVDMMQAALRKVDDVYEADMGGMSWFSSEANQLLQDEMKDREDE